MATRKNKVVRQNATRDAKTRRARRPAYLKRLHPAVRKHFATATDLRSFRAETGLLSRKERKLIVQQALIMLEQNYVHLPMKKAMHSVDPVQRLKLLFRTLDLPGPLPSPTDFHRELTETFYSIHDLHTRYSLPEPFSGRVAFLPFTVEDYEEDGQRKYIIAKIAPGFRHATFVRGVEVVYWNGVPIDRAVWNHAHRFAGSNRDARHARGLLTLTNRPLRTAPPPDEDWVVVGYLTKAGQAAELRFDWQVALDQPPVRASRTRAKSRGEEACEMDLELHIMKRMQRSLFAPLAVKAAKAARRTRRDKASRKLASALPSAFMARRVKTLHGTFGYLRVWTFLIEDSKAFVEEFIRLIQLLPQNGLIIDMRANGGGKMRNAEFLLQTLTPRRIEPQPAQFINSTLNLEMCRRNTPPKGSAPLTPWVESMEHALQTGAIYSAAFPVTDVEECNAIGQRYFGPAVLITDALSYSSTDIFAAGFQDHSIGPILGTDWTTGAGGANTWEHEKFAKHYLPGRVYKRLPKGADLRVAIRRTLRVGPRAGAVLEDFGVRCNERHPITRNDVLNKNKDLIDHAGSLLAGLPVRALSVEVESTSATQFSFTVSARGMTRFDVYVDERPTHSIRPKEGRAQFVIDKRMSRDHFIELRGFDGRELVARYKETI